MAQNIEAKATDSLTVMRREPILSREREHELALRWRTHGDTCARDELVHSQLRQVEAVVRTYGRVAYATADELIAEGNFGLLHALTKFDPDRGTRLVTYAVYWIRSYISQYLIRSRSLITTGVQSKQLARFRRELAREVRTGGDPEVAARKLADQLALSADKFHSLIERLDVRDVSWDAAPEGRLGARMMEAMQSAAQNAEEMVISRQEEERSSVAVTDALLLLDARERYIIEQRLMSHPDEQLSLAEIGRHFSVSRERARQIEGRAIRKLKAALIGSGVGAEWLADQRAA